MLVGEEMLMVTVCMLFSPLHAKTVSIKLQTQNAAAPCRRTLRAIKLRWFQRK